MRVQQSQAKHKLFIGGIPREMQKEQLEETLGGLVKGGCGGSGGAGGCSAYRASRQPASQPARRLLWTLCTPP